MAKEPWDQLEGESDDAYTRFLIYRNLGPNRSLRKGYHRFLQLHDGFTGRKERLNIPGTWTANSSEFEWGTRCAAWDIRNLHVQGARVVNLHTQAVVMIARKLVRLADKVEIESQGWENVLETLRTLNEYLSPEVVRGIKERCNKRREPAVSGGSSADAGDGIE